MEIGEFIFTIVAGGLATVLMWMGYITLSLALLIPADAGGFFIEFMGAVGFGIVLYYLFEKHKKARGK